MRFFSRRSIIKGFMPLPFYMFATSSHAERSRTNESPPTVAFNYEKDFLSKFYGIPTEKIGFLEIGTDVTDLDLIIDNENNKIWWCSEISSTINGWSLPPNNKGNRLALSTQDGIIYAHAFVHALDVNSIEELTYLPCLSNTVVKVITGPRKGIFRFHIGDFSSHLLQDPNNGIFVPSSKDKEGRLGCWVRDYGQSSAYIIDRSIYVNVNWFGADPSGAGWSSDAIYSAFQISNCVEFDGLYKYKGRAIPSGNFSIKGNNSTINIDKDTTLFCCLKTIGMIHVENINLNGGKICFDFFRVKRCDYTVTRTLKNINFKNYTFMATRLPMIDCPWWTIESCVFIGCLSNGTIGLWNNGGDNNSIRFNKFYKNEVHISTSLPHSHNLIFNNDFGQFEENDIPRANIWIRVPDNIPPFTGGTGVLSIENNKFGNENECVKDVKLLLANIIAEDCLPNYKSCLGGIPACHIIFKHNFHLSRASKPAHWMRSVGGWMPQNLIFELDNLQYSSFMHGDRYFCFMDHHNSDYYAIQIRPLAYRDSNLIFRGEVSNNVNISFDFIGVSNSIWDGDPDTHSSYSAGIGLATRDLTECILPRVDINEGAIVIPSNDSLGFNEAINITLSNSNSLVSQKLSPIVSASPAWIQGELFLPNNTSLSEVLIDVVYFFDFKQKDLTFNNRFQVLVKKNQWTSYSFPLTARRTDIHYIGIRPSFETKTFPFSVIWGRSRLYLSRAPGVVGNHKFDNLILNDLPTNPAGLPSGALWRDKENSNILKIKD